MLQTLEIPVDWTPSMQFSPDNRMFAFILPDHGIDFYDTNTWEKRFHISTDQDRPTAVAFSSIERMVAIGMENGSIIITRSPLPIGEEPGDLLARYLREGHSKEITSLAFDSEGTTLASSSADGSIRLWGLSR